MPYASVPCAVFHFLLLAKLHGYDAQKTSPCIGLRSSISYARTIEFQLMNTNLIFWRANNGVKKHGIDFGG
jgi:hypothetical protein